MAALAHATTGWTGARNLLSGTMAGALSGWVFGASVLLAVWGGLKLRLAAPR